MIKVQDIETIPDYQVLAVPALTLDRVVKVAGEVPKVEEIKDWIKWKGGQKWKRRNVYASRLKF